MKLRSIFLLFAGILALALCAPGEADVQPGVRVGAFTDPESFLVGGELLAPISHDWFFNPNAEFVSQPHGDLWAINFDVHYDLPTTAPVYFWVGAGPAILHRNPEGPSRSTTDLGANLFLGIGFKTHSRVVPYIQPKVVLSDKTQFGIAFGARF